MNIKIDKTKIGDFNIEAAKGLCNEALDTIWKEEWITRSVTKADKETLKRTDAIADIIRKKNKKVVFVAGGETGVILRAVKDMHPSEEDGMDILFMGDSLSPSEYAEVINCLNDEEFVIVAVTGREDDLAVRGAYATLKQMLISRFGIERATENIFVLYKDKENSIAAEASQNDYETIYYSENIDDVYAAGTEAVLLLISLIGGDAEKYLDGFRDMISSPLWDLDGADYSIMRGLALKEGYTEEKQKPMDQAPFGIVTIENAFSLLYTKLVRTGEISLTKLVELMSKNPAKRFGMDRKGSLEKGNVSDIILVDLDHEFVIDKEKFQSKGRNTPFHGVRCYGKVKQTFVNGISVYKEEN